MLTMSKHRGHTQHEIEDSISDMVDHISNLPDCLIHHILSFMPTIEAATTSVLSTRWKNLWTSVPNLDFDENLLMAKLVDGDVTSFVKFVEKVLRLRDASNMKKFRLSCLFFCDAIQIHSWISYAIMHNVQELDVDLHPTLFATEDPSVIPLSMFDSTSLVSLKIRIHRAIELPSHVSFPCLKTLHLSHVQISNDDFTIKLFSGCPVLEELVLSNCRWINLKNIAISISTLKSLTIRDLSWIGASSVCKMKIDAANLTYFEYFGFLSNEIILNNTSSLIKASCVHIPPHIPPQWQKEVTCRVINLFKQLRHVVSFRLYGCTLESLIYIDNTLVCFPVFPNLRHLMLTMILKNHTLMDLLSLCPVLQSICFSEGFASCMHLGENNSIWSSIPICISNCLKTVTLKNFHAYDSEICFLKCVLKYARVLERMDIQWSETELQGVKRKRKVRKELEKTERSSSACVIKFS